MFSHKVVFVLCGILSSGIANIEPDLTIQSSGCTLPESWKGEWYQNEFPSTFLKIGDRSISRGTDADQDLGTCVKQVGVNYIFENKHLNCTRCLFISSFHENVLQYKESHCAEDQDTNSQDHDNSLNLLCNNIIGQESFYLFKVDPKPIDCPFREGPYNFSYSTGDSQTICSHPPSTVGSCMDKSQLLLRFQGCPDTRTEGRQLEITCFGSWRDGTMNFLAAKVDVHNPGRQSSPIDGRYRCFVYVEIKEENAKVRKVDLVNTGYKVAISASPTCTGLHSPDVSGDKVLTLYKDKDEKYCQFPDWFTSKTWHTFDHHLMFETSRTDNSVHVNLEKALDKPGTQGAKMTCWKSKNDGNPGVSIIAKAAQGCHVQNICIKLHPKNEYISEVHIAEQSPSLNYEDFISQCFAAKNSSISLTFSVVTIISDPEKRITCPHLGQFHINDFKKAGKLIQKSCDSSDPLESIPNQLDIGCLSGQSKMEFRGGCENNDVDEQFGNIVSECIGSWQENDIEYLLTSFPSKQLDSSLIYCFQVYNLTDHLVVSGVSGNCPVGSKIHPDGNSLSFKLIPQNSCPTNSFDTDSDKEDKLLTLGSGASHLGLQLLGTHVIFFVGILKMPYMLDFLNY